MGAVWSYEWIFPTMECSSWPVHVLVKSRGVDHFSYEIFHSSRDFPPTTPEGILIFPSLTATHQGKPPLAWETGQISPGVVQTWSRKTLLIVILRHFNPEQNQDMFGFSEVEFPSVDALERRRRGDPPRRALGGVAAGREEATRWAGEDSRLSRENHRKSIGKSPFFIGTWEIHRKIIWKTHRKILV